MAVLCLNRDTLISDWVRQGAENGADIAHIVYDPSPQFPGGGEEFRLSEATGIRGVRKEWKISSILFSRRRLAGLVLLYSGLESIGVAFNFRQGAVTVMRVRCGGGGDPTITISLVKRAGGYATIVDTGAYAEVNELRLRCVLGDLLEMFSTVSAGAGIRVPAGVASARRHLASLDLIPMEVN